MNDTWSHVVSSVGTTLLTTLLIVIVILYKYYCCIIREIIERSKRYRQSRNHTIAIWKQRLVKAVNVACFVFWLTVPGITYSTGINYEVVLLVVAFIAGKQVINLDCTYVDSWHSVPFTKSTERKSITKTLAFVQREYHFPAEIRNRERLYWS